MAESSGTPETGIIFFRAGGHTHDGINSSLIDYTKYSLFDFGLGIETSNNDTSREYNRALNQQTFNQYISRYITSQVFEPAGIVLGENTVRGINIGAQEISADKILANSITAGQIAANTITATQIATNTITASQLITDLALINNTIRSNNYVANTSGWAIFGNGFAEFRNALVSGNVITSNIAATGGTIGGWTMTSTYITGGFTTLYSNGYISAASSSLTNPIIAGSSTAISSAGGGTIGGISINAGSLSNGVVEFGGNLQVFDGSNGAILNGSTLNLQFKNNNALAGQITAKYITLSNINYYYLEYATGSAGYNIFPNTSVFNIQPVGTGTVALYANLGSVVSGTTVVVNTNNQFLKLSSRRAMKYDITPFSNAIEKIKLFNPVKFKWRLNKNSSELSLFLTDQDPKYGFIVEEIEEIDTSLINYTYTGPSNLSDDEKFDDPTNFEPESYDTNGIISILMAALKEAVARIEHLELLNGV